jgi:hypothetical protein
MIMWRDVLMRFCGFLLAFVGVCLFLYGAFVCWIFRDGLGPDSVTSSGWLALSRFTGELWVFPCISIPLCAAGGYLWRRPSNNGMHPTADTTALM